MIIDLDKSKDRCTLLLEYRYKGYDLVIAKYKYDIPNYARMMLEDVGLEDWFCGYVMLPIDHQFYKKHYDDIPIDVHGGLTFGESFHIEDSKHYKKFAIGWDYNHGWDKGGNPELVVEDCKNVIDQLLRFDYDY